MVSAKPTVLLDIMLPMVGIDYCRELYDSTRTPVIMVSALREVDVVWIEIGAATTHEAFRSAN